MTAERDFSLTCHLPDEAATARFGARLAGLLVPGDWLALSGPLGAGKSALARAIIRAMAGDPALEVPSPSYTLVNVYETRAGEIWHADLYRLGAADDLTELGLEDAASALVLVEWPERMGGALPARHLHIAISAPDRGGRDLVLTARGGGWERLVPLPEDAA